MKLKDLLGKTIADFCDSRFTDANDNHCAHFVSHVLKLGFGMTCRQLTGFGTNGANVRVHEVFAQCPEVGHFKDWNGTGLVLAFVTATSNVNLARKEMRNVPQKHIGIYDGTHIYHYSNGEDKVVRQTPADFLKRFEKIYSGTQGLYFGTVPGSNLSVVAGAAPAAAASRGVEALDAGPISYWIAGKDVYARLEGGDEFYVGRDVKYGARRGLAQIDQLTGPVYNPAEYSEEFGQWAYLVYAIGVSESANRFNRINSYDRAGFTFGFFQLAAHTPKDNLVLLLRRAIDLPSFAQLYPDLVLKNGRLHRVDAKGSATDLELEVYNPKTKENELRNLMRYLNPTEAEVDPDEIVHAAKLVWLADNSQSFQGLQVRTSIQITTRKFRERYQGWYKLSGMEDTICILIADIHHQGRGKKAEVLKALGSKNPRKELLAIGAEKYPERCRSLKLVIEELEKSGVIGRHKYDAAHGVFVPV